MVELYYPDRDLIEIYKFLSKVCKNNLIALERQTKDTNNFDALQNFAG